MLREGESRNEKLGYPDGVGLDATESKGCDITKGK